MKNTKKSLLLSAISLVVCIAMLVGSTFAWFTDKVFSGKNIIVSGNLDVEMYWAKDPAGPWHNVEDPNYNTIFSYDNWEPGYTDVKYIKIKNGGSLAFNYKLAITPETAVGKLAEVINVHYATDAVKINDRTDLQNTAALGLLSNVLRDDHVIEGTLMAEGQQNPYHPESEVILTLAMTMITTAGNEYQNETAGKFSITAYAAQAPFEEDSFGANYDSAAELPIILNGGTISAGVETLNGATAKDVTLQGSGLSATIPAGTLLEEGAERVTLMVNPLEKTTSDITVVNGEILIPVDVHVDGVAENNTTPIVVNLGQILPKGLNMGNYTLYHVEDGTNKVMTLVNSVADLSAHNTFTYDPVTGEVSVAMASFSEVALVADTDAGWQGKYDYSWYDASNTNFTIANADQLAAFGQIVGGMAEGIERDSFEGETVNLIADVNLNHGSVLPEEEKADGTKTIFYPIGYYNSKGFVSKEGENRPTNAETGVSSTVYSFEGTFDGMGHTISNFYQNTWEMFGDYNDGYSGTPNYYKDAMGLFGYVLNGTVKNLTVDNFESDGEYTPTGVIAAFADGNSTFENIAITKCNPRVYNTGNGGIIGIAGDTSVTNDDHITLKNITVDNTNKISALWGSYDVACGGLVGMYRGNVDGSGNATGDTISFDNCHVAAIIDVYNDVCANYQYYAYRYAGMIIGSVRHNTKNAEGKTIPNMTGISATGCTVNYGDWNDYYYCEYEKNGHPSYSDPDDYKFSRVPNSEIDTSKGKENATCIGHNHTVVEDNQAIYLPFHQLFTGYSWGVSSIGLEKYGGIVTNLDIAEGDKEESGNKFDSKFTGDFLYRVGNQNTVSVGSLFAPQALKDKDGDPILDENGNQKYAEIVDAGVYVTINKVDENSNVSATFTKDADDWTKGTLQFSGTGVVKVTIQDYNFCTPTSIYLEVIDAKNITKAESATANDVVLLNDVSGTFVVSNSHTFYGNGFTVKLPTTSVQEVGQGFTGYISIGATEDSGSANGGNLDNVRIEGPAYPEMYIYRDQAKITDKSDPDYGSGINMRYFRNSVIVYGGNCTISNSYISGSRTALCLRGGNNVVIENTTLSGGAYANMQICAGSSVTLRDLTTVQVDENDSYGKGKKAHGLGIAVDSAVVDIYIEGELDQHNWLNQDQWDSIVPTTYQSVFPKFFIDKTFAKYWHYLNGGNDPYVNLAFIYACNWDTAKIHDNRASVDYDTTDATIAGVSGGVYSKTNTAGDNTITKEDIDAPEYIASGFNPVAPKLNFDNSPNVDSDDANDANDTYCEYNESTGTLKIGVSGDSKTLDLSKVSVTKNGNVLSHTAYLNGKQITGDTVTIKTGDGSKQTLTFKATSNDMGYDKEGKPISGSIEYTWNVTVEIAVLSYPAPVWNMGGNYQFNKNNCVYAYYSTSNGYGEAVQIYEGIKINYYDKSGKLVELDLSGTTTHPTGSNNSNSNAFTYTLPDGSTLTMKFSSGWKSGATTHQFTTYNNKVYIYPQSLDNDNYIRAKTTNQDFDVKISYTFTDPNGQSISQTMQWYNAKSTNSTVTTVQWKTFDSTNGKKPSTCVTPDTLITLADGSQKRVDELTFEDKILAWDFFTGSYVEKDISILVNHGANVNNVIYTKYSDSTVLKLVGEHGVFDYDLNRFVYITADNVDEYVGHRFVKQNLNGGYDIVTMVEGYAQKEYVEAWSISSAETSNAFASGLLTVAPPEDFYNWIEMDGKLHYDVEQFAKDVETYGLYTYEDFSDYVTYEQFVDWNGAYLKVAVEKGYFTFEYILELIDLYKGWMA